MEKDQEHTEKNSLDILLERAGAPGRHADGSAEETVEQEVRISPRNTDEMGENEDNEASGKTGREIQKTLPKDKKKTSRRPSAQEERARKAFHRFADLDEDDDIRPSMSLRGFFSGEMLGGSFFRRQLGYILLLAVLAIIYVSNRYACQRQDINNDKYLKELADRKFKLLTVTSELTEYSMRSNVEKLLPDTTLSVSTEAAFKLPVDSMSRQ